MPNKAKRPDPEVMVEIQALFAEMEAIRTRQKTKGGRGSYRFCFEVPEELATLAGWLAYKVEMDPFNRGEKLGRPVHLTREGDDYKLADWHRARRLMWSLIEQGLLNQLERLGDETHPCLFPETPEESRARWQLEDDIPF